MREGPQLSLACSLVGSLESSSDITSILQLRFAAAAAASCERIVPIARLRTYVSSRSMKRPRGLFRSQRSSGKPSPSEIRPEDGNADGDGDGDGDGDTDAKQQPTKRPKRDGSAEDDGLDGLLDVPRRVGRAADIEDWDDLKDLFNGAIEKYERAHEFL